MFTLKTSVKLHDTDAAGLLFFANQFRMVHDCYEACLTEHGLPFGKILATADYILPIVHAEADFNAPLQPGQEIDITLQVAKIGTTSFVLDYTLLDYQGIQVGNAQTVHVCMDAATRKKRPLADEIREAFEPHLAL